jgi:hypothetical protein
VPARLLQQPGRQQRLQQGLLHPHPGTLPPRRYSVVGVVSPSEQLTGQL